MEDYGNFVLVTLLALISFVISDPHLNVSDDVRTIPESILNVNQSVDIELQCVGSEDLAYYTMNPVTWSFISNGGDETLLTKSFYLDNGEKGHHDIIYTSTEPITFTLKIIGVKDSDNGVYRCEQKTNKGDVIASKNVTVTVLRPVEVLELTIKTTDGDVLQSSNDSLQGTSLTVMPGLYVVECTSAGSNPESILTFKPDNKMDFHTEHTSHFNPLDGRTTFNSNYRQDILLDGQNEVELIECSVDVEGTSFPVKSTSITVNVEKPLIECLTETGENETVSSITCKVTAEQDLDCNKISWKKGGTSYTIKTTDPINEVDDEIGDMNNTKLQCNKVDKILETVIEVSDVETEYTVIYGDGKFAHRRTVVLTRPQSQIDDDVDDNDNVFQPSNRSGTFGINKVPLILSSMLFIGLVMY